jgi:hypothetical protein
MDALLESVNPSGDVFLIPSAEESLRELDTLQKRANAVREAGRGHNKQIKKSISKKDAE